MLVTLGGESAKAGVIRWVILVATAVAARRVLEARSALPRYLK
jgi:hypothetical protein